MKADAEKLAKMTPDEMADLWDSLTDKDREKLRKELVGDLSTMSRDGAQQALVQIFGVVPLGEHDLDAMLAQANEEAVKFAQDRAAELVGMKWSEDQSEWIDNPNPEWCIDETTRERIQSLTTQAMEEGWSNDRLANEIDDLDVFGAARCDMIARTETAFADMNGNMATYEASGLVEASEWIVGSDDCDECQANADAGPVALGDAFPSGDDMPPAHPNCRCDLLPVLSQPEEEA